MVRYPIIICDDESTILFSLKFIIEQQHLDFVKEIHIFKDKEPLMFHLYEINETSPIFLLDIQFGETNSIELAKVIKQMYPNAQIIFMSEFDCYYEDVYQVEHVFFLKKPIKKEKLFKALSLAVDKINAISSVCIPISFKNEIYKVLIKDIVYFEKNKRLLIVHVTNKEYMCYSKLDEYLWLEKQNFMICHNSYMINLTRVKTFKQHFFFMDNGKEIPISRANLQKTKEAYLNYLEGQLNQFS